MKLIFHEYGRTIIAVSAAAGILFLVFTVWQIDGISGPGAFIRDSFVDELSVMESDDYLNISEGISGEAPNIFFDRQQVYAEKEYDLTKWFYATEAENIHIAVKLDDLQDENGKDMKTVDLSHVKFPSSGIYRIRVSAHSTEGKNRIMYFQIPVLAPQEVIISDR